MRTILLILSIVACLSSCQDKTTYILKGKVNGVADGTKVYLYEDLTRSMITDSTTVKDNQFVFEGKLEKPIMRTLKVEGLGLTQEELGEDMDLSDIAYISSLIALEPGKTIELLTINDKGYYIKYRGSSLMKKHATFWGNLSESGSPDSDGVVNMIKENKDNALGMFYFANLIEFVSPDSKTMKELYSLFSDKHGEDRKVDEVLDYIKNIDNFGAVGTKYTDFKAKTPDGQDIALSAYVGKKDIVLLHFFKWSGLHADKDYTYLRDAYAKYKDRGFEIVGIWIDFNTETWKEVIQKDNLTWPQMSDKNLTIQFIKTYALFDEPRTILIDKNGTIIDREIPRTELDKKLEKLLR